MLNVWVGRKLSSNYSARLKVVVISRSVRLLPTWLWWHNLGIGFAVRTAALLLTMHYCAALWPAIWTKKGVIVEVTKTDFISSLASNWQVKLVGLSCFIPWSIGRSWQKIQYSTNTNMKKWIYWFLNFITIFWCKFHKHKIGITYFFVFFDLPQFILILNVHLRISD